MIALLLFIAWVAPSASAGPTWPQWGGPSRNFVTDAPALATTWPAGGPRRIWQRPLGDGYSGIVSDGATLYTMYRAGEQDAVVAIDASTGKTPWETKYDAPFRETCSQQLGPVPRAAPLLAGAPVAGAGAAA